jgi:hypothetical protein
VNTAIGPTIDYPRGDGLFANRTTVENPYGIHFDTSNNNNMYMVDTAFTRIRMISSSSTGIVSTYAGGGTNTSEYAVGTNIQMSYPLYGLTGDTNGNLYYTTGCRIRRLSPYKVVRTIAGNSTCKSTGHNIPASSAMLSTLGHIYLETVYNKLYITESSATAPKIRMIDMNTNITSTIVGNGTACASNTIVNNTLASSSTCIANGLNDVYVNSQGDIYFNELYAVRKISGSTNIITLFAGTGTYSSTVFENVPATSTPISIF